MHTHVFVQVLDGYNTALAFEPACEVAKGRGPGGRGGEKAKKGACVVGGLFAAEEDGGGLAWLSVAFVS